MLTVVCFRWKNEKRGHVLPSQKISSYAPDWVYKLRSGVARHYSKPHRFVCITDEPEVLPGIETIPLWNDHAELGGCYRRLKLFDPAMSEILGDRFVAIDLDCVITGSLDPLFDRDDDFVINAYNGQIDQRYNGGLILMDAGCRRH